MESNKKHKDSLENKYSEKSNRVYKDLEQYKILCERRILELCPDHPMPVQESQLGSLYSPIAELQIARQKISKLENQLEKMSEYKFSNSKSLDTNLLTLLQEKQYLEETLRAEMLNSEEQRAYIEILKQALESGRSSTDSVNNEFKNQGFDIRRENANLKSVVKDLQDQISRTRTLLKDSEVENNKIFKENQDIGGDVQEIQEKIKWYKEELSKMEEEKNSLLEYIDEHNQKEGEMEEEMNDLVNLFEEMKINHSETMKKLHQETVKTKNFSDEIQVLKSELEGSMKLGREMQNTNEIIKQQVSELKGKNKKIKKEKMNLEIKYENLLANVATLSETLKETQEEIDFYQTSLEKIQKNLAGKQKVIEELKTECFNKSEEILTLKSISSSLEKEKSFKVEEKNEVLKDFEKEKQRRLGVTKKCEGLEEQVKVLSQELKSKGYIEEQLKNELKSLKTSEKELEIVKAEQVELKEKIKGSESTLQELNEKHICIKEEQEKGFKKICELTEENKRLNRELEDFEKMVVENKELHDLLSSEKAENEEFKEYLNSDRHSSEKRMKKFEVNVNRSEELIEYLEQKIKESEIQIEILKEELRDTRFQLENQEIMLLNLKNQFLSSVQVIIKNLLEKRTEPLSSLSEPFKQTIYNLNSNPSPDLLDICAFSEQASEHLNYLLNLNHSLQADLTKKTYEISLNTNRIEALSHEIDSQGASFSVLTQRLESSFKENLCLKSDFQSLSQENYELSKNLEKSFITIKTLKMHSDQFENTIKSLEFENRALNSEKIELQDLVKTYKSGNSKENLGVNNDLEGLERDRLELQCQLLKYQSDPRSKDGVMFRELGNRLNLCEKELRNYYSSFTPCSRDRKDTPLRGQVFRYAESQKESNRLRADSSQSYRERSLYNV